MTPEERRSREPSEAACLRAVANLLGRLLLHEVTADDLRELGAPALSAPLAELGFALPAPAEEAAWLEERGADYHDSFLRPDTGPLVQSLWTEGRYEGEVAVRVRQLAEHTGLEFQRGPARGAPVDHLGSLLLLWSECEGHSQAVADEIARAHLAWSLGPLETIAAAGGFYGRLAAAAMRLVNTLREGAPSPAETPTP